MAVQPVVQLMELVVDQLVLSHLDQVEVMFSRDQPTVLLHNKALHLHHQVVAVVEVAVAQVVAAVAAVAVDQVEVRNLN